jgi:chaperonin cofactor prefoldin
MNDEVKQQLIEILEEENEKLKEEIQVLKKREKRLEDNISQLRASLSFGRRGMPWG